MRPCRQRRARHDSGPRRASDIRLVVVHDTEGGTASSVASFFASTAQASTQLVVDDRECFRCLPDLVIPWGAPGANRHGLHIEHCGWKHWTTAEWLEHLSTLELSAQHAARWCWQYRIPRRWLTVAQLEAGLRGFCTHADATRAFPPNDGHTDPGPGFPKAKYMQLVVKHYRQLAAERAASSTGRG